MSARKKGAGQRRQALAPLVAVPPLELVGGGSEHAD
jgi:hypothetical protein